MTQWKWAISLLPFESSEDHSRTQLYKVNTTVRKACPCETAASHPVANSYHWPNLLLVFTAWSGGKVWDCNANPSSSLLQSLFTFVSCSSFLCYFHFSHNFFFNFSDQFSASLFRPFVSRHKVFQHDVPHWWQLWTAGRDQSREEPQAHASQ